MERGFENGGAVRGLVGVLGGRCEGRVVGQDKASTVSHGAAPRFRNHLARFVHRARTVRTVRTHLAEARKFAALSGSTWSFSIPLSFTAASTILFAALGFVARRWGLVITLTDGSSPVGIYGLVRKPVA